MDQTVDQGARDIANKALSGVEAHEKLCTERWMNAHREMEKMNGRLWWLITILICGQGSLMVILGSNLLKTLAR